VHKTIKIPFFITAFAFIFALAITPNASANLIQDANFTSVVNTQGDTGLNPAVLYGQFGTGYLTVTDWTTTGYNFVYVPGTIDAGTQANGATSGTSAEQAPGQYNVGSGTNKGFGNTYMWGINNSGSNTITAPPKGGNIIAMDGDSTLSGTVSQTITGLTVGHTYALTFSWAAAQQQSFTGTTSEALQVSLGTGTQTTTTYDLPNHSFSGWMSGTMYFTATGTSEVLGFLAFGAPNGEPPFTLLADVDLEVIPDFSNWMVFTGFGTVCIIFETLRRRRRRQRQSELERDSGSVLTGSFPGLA